MNKLFVAAPVLLALSFACGGAAAPQAAAPAVAPSEAGLKAFGESKVGDRQKCIISGEEFTVSDTSPKAEVAGRTYYFCCAGCAKKFQANPGNYLGKPGA
jgi:hypothetical protein